MSTSTKSNDIVAFDEFGAFEIKDPKLVELVAAGAASKQSGKTVKVGNGCIVVVLVFCP